MAQEREDYKEKLREAGRRRLEEFRRQRGAGVRGLATAVVGLAAGGAAPPSPPPASLELTTFRVLTLPAAVTAGPVPPPEPTELRMMAPALASTSLGALPPGSACQPPPTGPLSSSPCSVASAAGSASASSLGSSTMAGYVSARACAAAGFAARVSPGSSPGPGDRLAAAGEEEEAAGPARPASGVGRGGGGDQALVDMLLAQVEALMRDKAALAAENGSLRQQVEQLTELVGWLSLERGGSEGGDMLDGYEGSDAEGPATNLYPPECSPGGQTLPSGPRGGGAGTTGQGGAEESGRQGGGRVWEALAEFGAAEHSGSSGRRSVDEEAPRIRQERQAWGGECSGAVAGVGPAYEARRDTGEGRTANEDAGAGPVGHSVTESAGRGPVGSGGLPASSEVPQQLADANEGCAVSESRVSLDGGPLGPLGPLRAAGA